MLSITSRFLGENSDCYALAYEATHMICNAKKSAGTILAAIVKAVRMDTSGYFRR